MSAATAGPAVAAAPATGGMSLLLPLLMSFGPGIISKLFGGRSPQDQLKDQINQLLDPKNLAALRAAYYNQNVNSPGFTTGQNAIAAGANQTANAVAEKMGAHGISHSGTADVLSSMGPSLVGTNQAQLYGAADTAAASQTQQTIAETIAALYKTYGQASPDMQYAAAGWNNFTPYQTSWLKQNYPNLFPTGSANVGSAPTPSTVAPSATSYRAPTANTTVPTGSLASLYSPGNPGMASSMLNPATMSMLNPGAENGGLFGSTAGHNWTPPAVKVGRA